MNRSLAASARDDSQRHASLPYKILEWTRTAYIQKIWNSFRREVSREAFWLQAQRRTRSDMEMSAGELWKEGRQVIHRFRRPFSEKEVKNRIPLRAQGKTRSDIDLVAMGS